MVAITICLLSLLASFTNKVIDKIRLKEVGAVCRRGANIKYYRNGGIMDTDESGVQYKSGGISWMLDT